MRILHFRIKSLRVPSGRLHVALRMQPAVRGSVLLGCAQNQVNRRRDDQNRIVSRQTETEKKTDTKKNQQTFLKSSVFHEKIASNS